VCRAPDNADFVGIQTRPAAKLAEIPLPPARPVQLTQTTGAIAVDVPGQLVGEPSLAEAAQAVPLPARSPFFRQSVPMRTWTAKARSVQMD